MLGQHETTCIPVRVPQAGVHISKVPLVSLTSTLAYRPRLGPRCCQVGLGAMTVNLWLTLTAPTALIPPNLWPAGWRGAPAPLPATQGWKVSEEELRDPVDGPAACGASGSVKIRLTAT